LIFNRWVEKTPDYDIIYTISYTESGKQFVSVEILERKGFSVRNHANVIDEVDRLIKEMKG